MGQLAKWLHIEVAVPRFRLRFLLQEIDLQDGDTLIGRSAACQVTIEDPLVSRQHSRIRITGAVAILEDLSSRNGTFVNGRLIGPSHSLCNGDRIRIGTLELVFCTAEERAREARPGRRTTGFICYCAECGIPHPAELEQCTSCGSRRRVDLDTSNGTSADSPRDWMLGMMVEVLARAVDLQRWEEVERLLSRARPSVDGQLDLGRTMDRGQWDEVAEAAARISEHSGDARWLCWAMSVYAALGLVPPEAIVELCIPLPDALRRDLAVPVRRLLAILDGRGPRSVGEQSALERLRMLESTAGTSLGP